MSPTYARHQAFVLGLFFLHVPMNASAPGARLACTVAVYAFWFGFLSVAAGWFL